MSRGVLVSICLLCCWSERMPSHSPICSWIRLSVRLLCLAKSAREDWIQPKLSEVVSVTLSCCGWYISCNSNTLGKRPFFLASLVSYTLVRFGSLIDCSFLPSSEVQQISESSQGFHLFEAFFFRFIVPLFILNAGVPGSVSCWNACSLQLAWKKNR